MSNLFVNKSTSSPSKDLSISSFEYVFADEKLTTIGDYAFANCSRVTTFERTFNSRSNFKTIGDYAFLNCSNVESFQYTFSECNNLTTIGEGIFDGCSNVTNFEGTFRNCSNLVGKAPELWLRVEDGTEENGYIGIPDGNECFGGCTKLDNYEDIPDYWKQLLPQ